MAIQLIKTAAIFWMTLASCSLVASEYSLTKSVTLKGLFNDNVTLSPNVKSGRYGGTGIAAFQLSKVTEISQLAGDISLKANNYNLASYNTFDPVINISYTKQSENGLWGVSGNYSRDSTRTLDPEDENLDFSNSIDSRIFSSRLSANWNRSINEKNRLAWSANISDVKYESDFRNSYVYGQTSLLWQHFISERMRLQGNAAYSRLATDATSTLVASPLFFDALDEGVFSIDETIFLIDSCSSWVNQIALLNEIVNGPSDDFEPWSCFEERLSENTQTTVQLQLGVYYMLTQRLVLDLLVGKSSANSESKASFLNVPPLNEISGQRVDTQKNNDQGSVYQGSIEYSGESWSSGFRVSRNNSVNGNSTLSLVTQTSFDAQWRFDQYNSISGSISHNKQESSGQAGNVFFARDQIVASLRYNYAFAEGWQLTTVYRLKDQLIAGREDHGRSNQVAIIVAWRPAANKWSR